jgi:hypothetical protein
MGELAFPAPVLRTARVFSRSFLKTTTAGLSSAGNPIMGAARVLNCFSKLPRLVIPRVLYGKCSLLRNELIRIFKNGSKYGVTTIQKQSPCSSQGLCFVLPDPKVAGPNLSKHFSLPRQLPSLQIPRSVIARASLLIYVRSQLHRSNYLPIRNAGRQVTPRPGQNLAFPCLPPGKGRQRTHLNIVNHYLFYYIAFNRG